MGASQLKFNRCTPTVHPLKLLINRLALKLVYRWITAVKFELTYNLTQQRHSLANFAALDKGGTVLELRIHKNVRYVSELGFKLPVDRILEQI